MFVVYIVITMCTFFFAWFGSQLRVCTFMGVFATGVLVGGRLFVCVFVAVRGPFRQQ